MSYEIKVEDAEKVVSDIMELIKKCNNVENVRYCGVSELRRF